MSTGDPETNLKPLYPQVFEDGAITQLPYIDLFQYALNQLPSVYQQAPNFIAVLKAISQQKQYLYDIIRSLINSYNLNDALNTNPNVIPSATPTGVYAQLIASAFNAPYTDFNPLSDEIIISTQQVVVFINSRGKPSDFQQYFALIGLEQYFTNINVMEDGNATIYFNVPVINDPTLAPNPYNEFITAMNKLKAAGIEISVTTEQIPFFQLSSLPTDSPPYQVAPGNGGLGILQTNGRVINGGFLSSL